MFLDLGAMAYSEGHILVAYLCLMPLDACALSFHYNFSNPGDLDRAHLLYINDSSRAGDRINLTLMVPNSAGRVAYAQPVRLWDSSTGKGTSFTTSFTFAIGGNLNNTRGDGMAFFVAPFPPSLPPYSVAGYLGLVNNPDNMGSVPIVGIEFDTFWNDKVDPPNITADHIGIDVNSIHSIAYTTDMPNLSLYGTLWANISYDASSKIMAVSLQLDDGSTHSIQAPVDFKAAGVPQDAAVGFSAATGFFWESHQLLSWSFRTVDIADACNKTRPWVIPALIATCGVLGACLLVALLYIIKGKWFGQPAMNIMLPVAREFSYEELRLATNNFARRLGEGSYGEVFSGDLPDSCNPRQIAVKRLTITSEQTMRDYVTEIMTLGQLSHGNLLKLVGWCDGSRDGRPLLVYELMENRSVDKHLYPESVDRPPLPWPTRYRIAIGVGHAIEYLHTGCHNLIIIHRDIKPSNVMLDGTFEAKLGDFGLVRRVCRGQGSLGTAMFGSCNYMDPSCITTNTVSTASDMYSFGVLLLEMATGRTPSLLQGEGGVLSNSRVDAVRESYDNNRVLEMADERLHGEFDESQMRRVLLVGLLCTQRNRQDRPEIREAVNLLSNPTSHPEPQLRE